MSLLRYINHYRIALLSILLALSSVAFSQTTKWAFRIGNALDQETYRVHVEKDSNVFIAGYFAGSNIDFNPSVSAAYLMSSSGPTDAFVAKYDSAGNFRWAFRLGGFDKDAVLGITTDLQGNILITGFFRGTNVDFDPGAGTFLLSSHGDGGVDPGYGGDVFVAKYTSTGQFIWAFNIGGSLLYDSGVAIKTNSQNEVIVGGYFRESIDFDPSLAGTSTLSSSQGTTFLAKYNSNGQYQWAFNFGGGDVDNSVLSITIDNTDNIYACGFFQGTNIDFNPGAGTALLSSNGDYEIFAAKYNSAGQYQWAFSAGSSGSDVARSIQLDENGNVYLAGDYALSVDFDPSASSNILNSYSGSTDAFIAKYTNSGQFIWANHLGGGSTDIGGTLAVRNGDVCLIGYISGTNCDMDGGSGTAFLNSNGGHDFYVAKYNYSGQYKCSFNIGGSQNDYGYFLVADNNGNYYGGGNITSSNVNFQINASSPAILLTSAGGYDAYLFRFNWVTSVPSGTIQGNSICTGGTAQLTFTATGGVGPFSLTYTDGTNIFTQNNVQSGVPFNLPVNPTVTTVYTLQTITDASRCPVSASVSTTATVTVNVLPQLDAGADTAICWDASTVQLHATGTGIFSWTPVSLVNNPSISNPIATVNNDTTFYVTLTAPGGCINKDSIKVTKRLKPFVSAGTDTSLCLPGSLQLQATGSGSFSWQPASLLTNANTSTPTVNISTDTSFIVTLTDAFSCTNKDTVRVFVKPKPSVFAGLDTSVCPNTVFNLNGSGSGTYSWSPASLVSNPSIQNPSSSISTDTSFYLTVTGVNGCTNKDTVKITIKPAPSLNAGTDTSICRETNSIQMNASGTGVFNWMPVALVSNPGINNPIATVNNDTTFYVSLTGANGCISRDSVKISKRPVPFLFAGNDTSFCFPGSVQLQATGTGSFSWQPSTLLTNYNTATPTTNISSDTSFVVTITDAFNCINTDTVKVFVKSKPSVFAGSDTSVCPNTAFNLNGSGSGTYSWSPASLVSDPSLANPSSNIATDTSFYLTVTGANGCTNKDTVNVTLKPTPSLNAGTDTSICRETNSIQLNASGTGVFSWTPVALVNNTSINNPIATVNSDTTFYVSLTGGNGCISHDSIKITKRPLPFVFAGNDTSFCFPGSVQLQATGTGSFSWQPATLLSNANTATPTTNISSDTSFVVTITDAFNCINTDSVKVTVKPRPYVFAGNDTTVCPATVFYLNGSGNGTFSWSPASLVNDPFIANPFSNLNIDTTFYLTVTGANGCTNIDSIDVHPRPAPFISAGNDTLVCRNASFILHASGSGSFNWQPSSLLMNANSNSPTANISDTTKFYVTITDIYNCTNTDSVIVYTKPVPVFGLTASSNAVCPSQSVQFNATGGDIYQWQPVPGLSSTSVPNPTATLSSPTTYNVTITSSACGESTTLNHFVDTLPGPVVTVSSSNEIDCYHAHTQLSASGGATYQWIPSRGLSDPSIPDPVAEVDVTTVFSVLVTSVDGCRSTKDITVVAAPKPSVLLAGIPNAFTPNNDGTNDCFGLKNWSGVSSLSMAVFNRFGEMIFYTTDPKQCWDGTYKGKPQPVDTYVYYVNAVIKCGPISKKGYVVLMR